MGKAARGVRGRNAILSLRGTMDFQDRASGDREIGIWRRNGFYQGTRSVSILRHFGEHGREKCFHRMEHVAVVYFRRRSRGWISREPLRRIVRRDGKMVMWRSVFGTVREKWISDETRNEQRWKSMMRLLSLEMETQGDSIERAF